MKIEFKYKKAPPYKEVLPDIDITEIKDKRVVTFYNRKQLELAKKSKVFLEDLFNVYYSPKLDRSMVEITGENFRVHEFFDKPVLDYLSNYSYTEKKEIIRSLSNLSNKYSKAELANKFSLFFVNIKKLSRSFANDKLHQSIMPTLKSLHRNTIPREPHVNDFYSKCKESYSGFIRAIKSGTLTTAKVMIDGKERRMFFKSSAGTTETSSLSKKETKSLRSKKVNVKEGYVSLAIDPTTLDIYAIRTEKGIHYGKPAKVINKNLWMTKKQEQFMRRTVESALKKHLNETYAKRTKKGKVVVPGIKRMKGIYRRMSSRPL